MTSTSVTLAQLVELAREEVACYTERDHPPEGMLGWLGVAVGALPELTARARAADQIPWRTPDPARYAPLVGALESALAFSAATLEAAFECHLARHPDGARFEDDVEGYAQILGAAHGSAPRRAEFLLGGHASFLAGAIEAAGLLADAELAAARARRWEREDHDREIELRAGQLTAALTNALGGLLAYARLYAGDGERRPH